MRGRRLLIGLNVVVAVCLAATAGAYGYLQWQKGRITVLDLPSVSGGDDKGDDDRPVTVLLVGSDSRKGLSAKDRKAFGTETQSGGERSDALMLIRLDRATRTARSMSVPRDLWVPIAGTNKEAKINSALDGGQDRLAATVESALGVQIDHYVQVDFKAFRGVVDALGGVDIPFRAPARDAVTGLSVKKAGCVHLNGESALQYVRSREYEEFFRGGWHLDGRRDLGRIERQQGFMRQLAAQADLPSNVTRINKLISSVVTNLTVDSGFDVDDMTDLALAFRGKGANALQPLELPVKVGRAGGQSVVFLDKGADDAITQLLHGMTPLSPASAPSAPAPSTAAAPAPSSTSTTPTTAAPAC